MTDRPRRTTQRSSRSVPGRSRRRASSRRLKSGRSQRLITLLTGNRTRLIVSVASVLLVFVVVFALYAQGGGPVPAWLSWMGPGDGGLLAPSSPEEAALRTVRLAGFEHAVVGEERGVAVIRLAMPGISSPADVELAWQTGMGVLASSYPEATRYVVQLFEVDDPLLEIAADGVRVREAVRLDDGQELRDAAVFTLLTASGGGL